MSRELFWDSTPKEIEMELDAIRLRRRDEMHRDRQLAWMTGMLARADRKFPELSAWMGDSEPETKVPTHEEAHLSQMKSNMYLAAALSGGTVTTKEQREAAEAAEKNQGSV